jgi:hypothetical protein
LLILFLARKAVWQKFSGTYLTASHILRDRWRSRDSRSGYSEIR